VIQNRHVSAISVVVLTALLTACAAPDPVLRSNKQLLFYGKQKAEFEVDMCRKRAERNGLRPGAYQSENAATGAVLGTTLGGAVGASAGAWAGLAGVAIGAAAGAGLGLIIGLTGGTFKPLVPDPLYADAVTKCLEEKGYEVSGWE